MIHRRSVGAGPARRLAILAVVVTAASCGGGSTVPGADDPDAIRKSGEHAEAFKILKSWQANPKEGLF